MSSLFYYIKIEDEQGSLKNYLRFKNKQRAFQVYEYLLDSSKERESIKLMDQDFNLIVPFHEGDDNSFKFYQ